MTSTKETIDSLNPLEGASSAINALLPTLFELKSIASDVNRSIDERLEAIEDIFESEVGDTTLTRARNLEREFNIRQLYIKFEGGNPSGTQKDRIAFSQVIDALRRGFDKITVATCGNYGVAVSFAASLVGMKCIIYLPENYHTKRINEMIQYNAEIRRSSFNYEDTVRDSQEYARNNDVYDANPGGLNTPLQLKAYGEISYEIYDALRDSPAAISVPVSNGTTLAGIYKGFTSLYRRGKVSKIPRIIAGSTFNKNPIIRAFKKNLTTCEDLSPLKIKETSVNEPLINWHSIDGDYALEALKKSNGMVGEASDKNMIAFSKLIKEKEGFSVLPASTAGLIAFMEIHKKTPFPNDRYVIVLTGKKS